MKTLVNNLRLPPITSKSTLLFLAFFILWTNIVAEPLAKKGIRGAGSSKPNAKPSLGIGKKHVKGDGLKSHGGALLAGAVISAAAAHQLSSTNYKYKHDGRDYYYGDKYYQSTSDYASKCSVAISSDHSLRYEDGYIVTKLVFECDSRSEQCCDAQCCKIDPSVPWWNILFVVVGALVVSCFVVFWCLRLHKKRQMLQEKAAEAEVEAGALEPLQISVK